MALTLKVSCFSLFSDDARMLVRVAPRRPGHRGIEACAALGTAPRSTSLLLVADHRLSFAPLLRLRAQAACFKLTFSST